MYLLAMYWGLNPVYYAETNITTITPIQTMENTRHIQFSGIPECRLQYRRFPQSGDPVKCWFFTGMMPVLIWYFSGLCPVFVLDPVVSFFPKNPRALDRTENTSYRNMLLFLLKFVCRTCVQLISLFGFSTDFYNQILVDFVGCHLFLWLIFWSFRVQSLIFNSLLIMLD